MDAMISTHARDRSRSPTCKDLLDAEVSAVEDNQVVEILTLDGHTLKLKTVADETIRMLKVRVAAEMSLGAGKRIDLLLGAVRLEDTKLVSSCPGSGALQALVRVEPTESSKMEAAKALVASAVSSMKAVRLCAPPFGIRVREVAMCPGVQELKTKLEDARTEVACFCKVSAEWVENIIMGDGTITHVRTAVFGCSSSGELTTNIFELVPESIGSRVAIDYGCG